MELSEGARATMWLDGYRPTDAEVLVRYDHRRFGDFAAVTRRRHGEGSVVSVGTVPNPALAEDLFRMLVPSPKSGAWARDEPVTVMSGEADGRRIWFLHNWSEDPAAATVPHAVVDLVSGAEHPAGAALEFGPWSSQVLAGPA